MEKIQVVNESNSPQIMSCGDGLGFSEQDIIPYYYGVGSCSSKEPEKIKDPHSAIYNGGKRGKENPSGYMHKIFGQRVAILMNSAI